jgi:polysaccharide export outer membrane protein
MKKYKVLSMRSPKNLVRGVALLFTACLLAASGPTRSQDFPAAVPAPASVTVPQGVQVPQGVRVPQGLQLPQGVVLPQGTVGGSPTGLPTVRTTQAEQGPDAASKGQQDAADTTKALDVQTDFEKMVQTSLGTPLAIYGRDLFSAPSTFSPLDRVPVTSDYVIGPGDELLVRSWGQLEWDLQLTVDRSGEVNLPRVGNLPVAGTRFRDVEGVISRAAGRVYRDFKLSVTMGRLRSIQVFVVGNVARPGAYTLSSLSTMLNAVLASGGPSKGGSLRGIELRRGGAGVARLDLYDLLLKGDKSGDRPLLPGDVIFVPPVGPLAAISGPVNRPAIYELRGETRVGELIDLAGGRTTVAAADAPLKLERIEGGSSRRVYSIEMARAEATVLQGGDLVMLDPVAPKFSSVVTLRGNVFLPGRYPLKEGMRVRDLIPSREALITRDYWERRNQSYRRELGSTTALMSELNKSVEEINWEYAVVERLDQRTLVAKLIPFNLGRALDGDPQHNLVIRSGDIVTIFSQNDIATRSELKNVAVRLQGEFLTPGVYQLRPNETLRQLVMRVGLSSRAYVPGIRLLRKSLQVEQQQRLDEILGRMKVEADRAAQNAAAGAVDSAAIELAKTQLEGNRRVISKLSAVKAEGRLVLRRAGLHSGVELPDISLQDGDVLEVPERSQVVSVFGAVFNQSSFLYSPGASVDEYVRMAGGSTREADTSRVYVIRAGGEVVPVGKGWVSGLLGSFGAVDALPGDTVVVPIDFERVRLSKELRDWAQIFYQMSLGVAGLKVLKNL